MRAAVDKIACRFEELGPHAALQSLVDDAWLRVVDANREIVLMAVDLAHPKAHLQPGEADRWRIEMRDLDDAMYPRVVAMLEQSERWRIEAVLSRRGTGAHGFVAMEGEAVVGFFFYALAGDRPPHPDLEWLGFELGPTEGYSYDAFVPPALRGRGGTMFRAAYDRLRARGITRLHGFCYAVDKAPMFTYRMLGWQETGRIFEHRLVGKLALVGGGLYKLNRFDRRRLVSVPDAVPSAVARLGRAR